MSEKKRTSGQMSLTTVAWNFFREREPWKRGFSATIVLAQNGYRYCGVVVQRERGASQGVELASFYATFEERHHAEPSLSSLRKPALGVASAAPMSLPPHKRSHVDGGVSP
jgi:hypothetical protein